MPCQVPGRFKVFTVMQTSCRKLRQKNLATIYKLKIKCKTIIPT